MKKVLAQISLTCFLCMLCMIPFQRSLGQNIREDMKNIHSKFEKAASIQYDIKVLSYATAESAPDVDKYYYEQNGNQFYFHTSSIEFFADKKISLIVYKDSKIMLWSKSNSAQLSYKKNLPGINPDSMFIGTDSIKFIGEIDGLKKYAIYSSGYILRTEINIDPKTNQLVDIIYFYDTKQKMGYYKAVTHFDRLILSDEVLAVSKVKSDFITGEIPDIKVSSRYSTYNLKYVDNE